MKKALCSLLFGFTAILCLSFVSCKQTMQDTPIPETQTPNTPVTQGLNAIINAPVLTYQSYILEKVVITIIPYTGATEFDETTSVFSKTIPLAEMSGTFKIDLPVGRFSVRATSFFTDTAGNNRGNYLGNYRTNFNINAGIYRVMEINPGTVIDLLVFK